jgi:hypothetical protein
LLPNPSEYLRDSAAASCFFASRDFCERPCVSSYGFWNSAAMDELPSATAGDQSGFAQDLEMVGNSRGRHAAHRNDLAASHLLACRDGLKNPEAGLVGQGLRYFFDLGTVRGITPSVTKSMFPGPAASSSRKISPENLHPIISILI